MGIDRQLGQFKATLDYLQDLLADCGKPIDSIEKTLFELDSKICDLLANPILKPTVVFLLANELNNYAQGQMHEFTRTSVLSSVINVTSQRLSQDLILNKLEIFKSALSLAISTFNPNIENTTNFIQTSVTIMTNFTIQDNVEIVEMLSEHFMEKEYESFYTENNLLQVGFKCEKFANLMTTIVFGERFLSINDDINLINCWTSVVISWIKNCCVDKSVDEKVEEFNTINFHPSKISQWLYNIIIHQNQKIYKHPFITKNLDHKTKIQNHHQPICPVYSLFKFLTLISYEIIKKCHKIIKNFESQMTDNFNNLEMLKSKETIENFEQNCTILTNFYINGLINTSQTLSTACSNQSIIQNFGEYLPFITIDNFKQIVATFPRNEKSNLYLERLFQLSAVCFVQTDSNKTANFDLILPKRGIKYFGESFENEDLNVGLKEI